MQDLGQGLTLVCRDSLDNCQNIESLGLLGLVSFKTSNKELRNTLRVGVETFRSTCQEILENFEMLRISVSILAKTHFEQF
jgi:hypothetical protein